MTPQIMRCQAHISHHDAIKSTVPALKEWGATIQALGQGKQTVLFRKGGVREPIFSVAPDDAFLLFPTAFHADAAMLKPSANLHDALTAPDPRHQPTLTLAHAARLTGAWTTDDPTLLPRLDHMHIYTQAFVDARLRWRAAQKLTILELRVWKLDPPICIPNEGHLWGCFSWVDVSAAPGWDTPGALALDDDAFAAKQAALREALQVVEVLEGF